MVTPTILVVDDEQLVRWSVKQRLAQANYRVLEAEDAETALKNFADEAIDLALLDYKLPGQNGIELLRQLKVKDPDMLVILMTAHASVENVRDAMKLGAYDYVNKPFDLDEMLALVEKALETTTLRREVRALRASHAAPYSFDHLVGDSPAMQTVKTLLAKVASSPASTVLITGESGTGKDRAAKSIHYNSDRSTRPFMNITCSALPEALLESELFGHERGAFTDAKQQKKGLLELADGGTVFLDEIGEMAPALQAKLLRFLEEKAFKRLGGTTDIRPDVRVIAATHRDLRKAVQEGAFREDLYYRLTVLPVHIPPLRQRGHDIEHLGKYFLDVFNREFGKSIRGFSPEALKALYAYGWPGNVRELRNAIERAMLLTENDQLEAVDFQMLASLGTEGEGFRLPVDGVRFEELERDFVVQALERAGGNQTQAAALLGMNRDQIRYRIEKFGIAHPRAAQYRKVGST